MVRSELKRNTIREDYGVRRVIKEDKDWGRALFRPASVHRPSMTSKKGSMTSYHACVHICDRAS